MELRTLRYFLAVAREESMTETANVLHVTQPTLSRQIADLERELGCDLFVRTNRSTQLTERGMRLRQRAEEILSLVERTEEEVGGEAAELSGCVRIGAGEISSMSVLTDAFATLRAEHPAVTCELFTGNADVVEERLERGLIDVGVMIEPVRVDKYEHLRLPGKERLGVMVAADSVWAGREGLGCEDLRQIPLLVSSRTTHETFDLNEWSGGALTYDDLEIVGRFDMVGNAARLVRTGITGAMVIDHLVQPEEDVIFVPLEPELSVGSWVVWKRYRLLSDTCSAFIDLLRERCA